MGKKCYFCGQHATSREHVPPKSFFPEESRINLITVPSCKIHNNEKSGMDEYVLQLFSATYQRNDKEDDLHKYLIKKCIDSLMMARNKKSTKTIFDTLEKNHKNPRNVIMANAATNNVATNTIQVDVDNEKLFNFIESVAKGLLYKEIKILWNKFVSIYPHFLMSIKNAKFDREISEKLENLMSENHSKGSSPDIFWYTVNDFKNGEYLVDMCFYRQFKVTCVFKDTE